MEPPNIMKFLNWIGDNWFLVIILLAIGGSVIVDIINAIKH